MTRFWLIQVIGVCALVAAWWQGWPQTIYAMDQSYLSVVIAGLLLYGIGALALGYREFAGLLSQDLPTVGLCGTVIGLTIVAVNSGLDVESMRSGLGTAFFTTIAGIISSLWLKYSAYLGDLG